MLRKIKPVLLSLLSAVFLILSFPNYNWEFLAWFGFVPLFFALQGKSKLQAFLISYLCGLLFWAGTIYWLIHVTLAGLILLVLYLALYFALFGLLVSSGQLSVVSCQWFFISATWVLLEYLRSHLFTGFPWALLGYSQYLNLPIIQIADITGVWGISFLVMLANVWIYFVVRSPLSVVSKKSLFTALVIFLVLFYGYFKIHHSPLTTYHSPLRVSLIQGNIPQELKWREGSENFILDRYLSLTEEAAKEFPDLILWPEAAHPTVYGEEDRFFSEIFNLSRKIKIPLLIGAVKTDKERYFNSALLIQEGQVVGYYDKLHLVPFGEYIPLKRFLPFLQTVVPIGDITAGREYTIFKLPVTSYQLPVTFSVLICFEDLFPELSREFVKKGADLLVNITNDAWYKKSSAGEQHLQAAVLRAVENRRNLARCANTGISAFIAPTGKIISLLKDKQGRNIFITGQKTENLFLPGRKVLTFYSRWGDWFMMICFFITLCGIIKNFKKRK